MFVFIFSFSVSFFSFFHSLQILGELYTTEPSLSSVKVCPSFDRFGEGSPSITYFIKVLVGDIEGKELATFDLSIESIPNLLPEEGLYPFKNRDLNLIPFSHDFISQRMTTRSSLFGQELRSQTLVVDSVSKNPTFFLDRILFLLLHYSFLFFFFLGNSPIYLKGTSLAESNGGTEPRYYPIGALIPLTECISYSVSVELLNLNTEVFNYFTLVFFFLFLFSFLFWSCSNFTTGFCLVGDPDIS